MDDFNIPLSVALDIARYYARAYDAGGRVGYDDGGGVPADASPVTTADILQQMPQPSSWHDKYVKPWGSAALAQQEPNWFGRNILSRIPPEAMLVMQFLGRTGPRMRLDDYGFPEGALRAPKPWAPEFVGPPDPAFRWTPKHLEPPASVATAPRSAMDEMIARAEATSQQRNKPPPQTNVAQPTAQELAARPGVHSATHVVWDADPTMKGAVSGNYYRGPARPANDHPPGPYDRNTYAAAIQKQRESAENAFIDALLRGEKPPHDPFKP